MFYGNFNIDSIRKNFESVQEIIQNTFDIFLFSETKIDLFFQVSNLVSWSTEVSKMIVIHMGRLLFYVNQDLNCKVLTNYPMYQDFEILTLKLKLFKISWLIIGTYKSLYQGDITFIYRN